MTPEEICNQTECTGCSACMNVCTHNAITMTGDEEEFIHPFIDIEKSLDMGQKERRINSIYVENLLSLSSCYNRPLSWYHILTDSKYSGCCSFIG